MSNCEYFGFSDAVISWLDSLNTSQKAQLGTMLSAIRNDGFLYTNYIKPMLNICNGEDYDKKKVPVHPDLYESVRELIKIQCGEMMPSGCTIMTTYANTFNIYLSRWIDKLNGNDLMFLTRILARVDFNDKTYTCSASLAQRAYTSASLAQRAYNIKTLATLKKMLRNREIEPGQEISYGIEYDDAIIYLKQNYVNQINHEKFDEVLPASNKMFN